MGEPIFNNDNVLFVKVNQTYQVSPPDGRGNDLYLCARGVWRVNKERAERMDYVVPHKNGIILGVFKAKKWHSVSNWNAYPDLYTRNLPNKEKRLEFDGEEIKDPAVTSRYVGKSVPEKFCNVQNPAGYWENWHCITG